MFSAKKHSPYELRIHYEPAQLKSMIDQSKALYEQTQFLIERIREQWRQNGFATSEELEQ